MPLIVLTLAILLLLVLTLKKVNPFIGLLIVSIGVGIALGMPLQKIGASIQQGVGDILGSMALILCLGAMLGKLLEVSGAAQQISETLIDKFGENNIQWAVMITGFLIGIPLFYNAGFIILVPLIFSIAKNANKPLLWVAIPMAASLSVTHGFLPPHPGPTGLAAIFNANVGMTLLYGIIISIPTIIIAGPLFSATLKNIKASPGAGFFGTNTIPPDKLPGKAASFFIALIPVLIIGIAAFFVYLLPGESYFKNLAAFIGDPVIALLISAIVAALVLNSTLKKSTAQIMQLFGDAISSIALIMMIIAAGGAFKQVLIDSGLGEYIASFAGDYELSPLIAGWAVAALLRVTLGSATVAGLTAAGIVLPLLSITGTSPELMVLAVGAGSLMFSHVNDTGFWMFKEFFNLSLKQTFLSWSIMETIVSITGLLGVLLFQYFV